MPRLSSPVGEIKDYYTVLVVGSGYGGAIAASRLARAGQRVCVLERGREFQSGEFPDTEAEAAAETQAELPGGHAGSRLGLYSFHINADVNVFAGCGLGGSSLINGNVAVRPEPRVFEDPRWPAHFRGDLSGIEEGYRHAAEMLRPVPYPDAYPALPKLLALEQSAAHLGYSCSRAPIAVNFASGVNHVGISQRACMLCGDCITGCNYSAKNTVMFNYLPDARQHGAEIYTQVSVDRLDRQDGRWVVHYRILETGWENPHENLRTVSADLVVLAAGTLGSTEILLRSQAAGLALSNRVGQYFSGNGDAIGYSFGCTDQIRSIGYGHRDPRDLEPTGPCVTGIIDIRGRANLDDGIVIQEITTPGAIAGLLPVALAETGAALGKVTGESLAEALDREAEVETLSESTDEISADHTQAYLVTTHERGAGAMRLEGGHLRLEWPRVGEQPIFQKVNATLAEATRALGGSYRTNPVWSTIFDHDLLTLHPLGGCVMADDAEGGVVNHKGQAFSGASGTAVYDGLYVCDGSTVPRSLGVGPLLTISALAERACALMAHDRGWRIDYAFAPLTAAVTVPAGLIRAQFNENIHGDTMELDVTVVTDDLEALLRDPSHAAHVGGRLRAPSISEAPFTIGAGRFAVLGPGRVSYKLNLENGESQPFFLEASKEGPVLAAVLYRGESAAGQVVARSDLRLSPIDLERQLNSLRVWGAPGNSARLRAIARLGGALAGDLYEIYGSVSEQRKKRPLSLNAPTVHRLPSAGTIRPRLIRYEGGSRGPVLLVPGAGFSIQVFTLDTIENNLVEFLFARGYDVWLLDAGEGAATQTAVDFVKHAARKPHVHVMTAAPPRGGEVELNAATRDAVPESWRALSIIGRNAACDVYPGILDEIVEQSAAAV